MINIQDIKGLKYPDEYFIKFFFKNKLHKQKNLTYLEFGCGNGSNLMLPYSYENKVLGVDYNQSLINMANDNFSLLNKNKSEFKFYAEEMRKFAKNHKDLQAKIFTLPNIVNYITKKDFVRFLLKCKENRLYDKNALFFIRFRTTKDFRHGFGERINENCYQVDSNLTGENNAINTLYRESEMLKILETYLGLEKYKVFNIDFENEISNGDVIFNSDIVIWGEIN